MPTLTFETAREAVRDRLSESAAIHSEAVAEQAGVLAGIYDVDVEDARIAGLLHDWAREVDSEMLLADARAAGYEVTCADERVPYLLHAKVGSAQVHERFPDLPDSVVGAIEHHTMGRSGMTPLDMVVYLADMLEPARVFPGVDDLRSLAGAVSLAELYFQAYAASLHHLITRRRVIHPSTVDSWNTLIAEESR